MLLGLEGCLQAHVKNPIVLIAASTDEVNSLACLKNLVSEVVRQERWDHDIVELVLLSPELIIPNIGVCLNKELLKRIIYLACHHPYFDH